MSEAETSVEPDWETPLGLTTTPDTIIHTIFASADTVHTGWESCVDHELTMGEVTALDDRTENYCRLVEQEYVEKAEAEVTWHDWAVELKLGDVYVTGHWRAPDTASPSEWDWCSESAQNAFASACILVGKRVRRGLLVDESSPGATPTPRTRH